MMYLDLGDGQGIATAPILFALEEEPQLLDLIERKFSEEGDKLLVRDIHQNLFGTNQPHLLILEAEGG